MVQGIDGALVELLRLYQNNTKKLPTRLIVYRDGVSEGQYQLVVQNELPMIREAFKRVYGNAKHPLISIVICGKRHHTRFYPTNMDNADKSGNPVNGTIVDRVCSENAHDRATC